MINMTKHTHDNIWKKNKKNRNTFRNKKTQQKQPTKQPPNKQKNIKGDSRDSQGHASPLW